MEVRETDMDGLILIEPSVFGDERGSFHEAYNKSQFDSKVAPVDFVQDNLSVSKKNTLRGLHFQSRPWAQAKLVSVLRGSVLDVCVDIRKASPTYGSYYSVELSEKNKLQLFVPAGFAHGFLALEDDTVFSYKCSNYYSKESEGSILWNDTDLKIDWKVDAPLLSDKDSVATKFSDFTSPF